MLEKATVISIDDKIVTLACNDSEGCKSCAAHGICGGTNDKSFQAWNSNGYELEPGSNVEVNLPTGKTIGAAFMVMILPSLLFFLFYFGTGYLLETPQEGFQVLGGLVGIAAGFGLNFLINRKPNKKSMPEITRMLD